MAGSSLNLLRGMGGGGIGGATVAGRIVISAIFDSSEYDDYAKRFQKEFQSSFGLMGKQVIGYQKEIRRELASEWGAIAKDAESKAKASEKYELDMFNSYYDGLDRDIKETQRFRGEWMSLMFLGMGISSMFGGWVQQTMSLFGITELFSVLIQSFLIPVFKRLMPFFSGLFKLLMGLPPSVKGVIGVFILLIAIVGAIMFAVFSLGLGLAGLGVTLGGTAGVIGAAMFAGKALLVLMGIAIALWIVLEYGIAIIRETITLLTNLGNLKTFNQALGEATMSAVLGQDARTYQTSNAVTVNANVSNKMDSDLLGRRIYEQLQGLQSSALG